MALPSVKLAIALSLCLLLSGIASADFSMRSLSVLININKDGTVHAEERLSLVINGSSSKELYDATRSTYSDLATWKDRTQLSEMRHHVTRANTDISNLRVLPQAIERCNSFVGTCYATVVIDYTVPVGQNGSGLVKVDHYKPRTAKYSLVSDALSFDQTKTGDLILPTGTNISISIPQNSEKIYFSSLPQNLVDASDSFLYDEGANLRYYTGEKRTFYWQGDMLSKFQFTYEIEAPLESEVIEFFADNQKQITQFFLGPQGLAAIIVLAAAVASAFYLNRVNSE